MLTDRGLKFPRQRMPKAEALPQAVEWAGDPVTNPNINSRISKSDSSISVRYGSSGAPKNAGHVSLGFPAPALRPAL